MKKALALILVLVMLCATLVPVVSATTPATINLQEFYEDHGYASTYVGKALSDGDAKPQQDGVIGDDEYQKEYVVGADGKTLSGAQDAIRAGIAATLLGEYKEYVSHDAEWIYIGFDFYSGESSGVRLYWNLSIINSFDFTYNGGSTVNAAFTQNGRGIADGLNLYLRETAQYASGVTAGTDVTAPTSQELVVGTKGASYTAVTNAQMHLTYELKISKAWYATQLGIQAEDVVNVAWTTLGSKINVHAVQYTQIGHYITDTELADLETTYGATYTRPSGTASHPYDNAVLPRLFILDEEPDDRLDLKAIYDSNGYASTYVGKALADGDAKPVQDGVIGATEYQKMRVVNKNNTNCFIKNAAVTTLMADYKEYISHDDEWIYVAFDYIAGNTSPLFKYHLSFVDSFKYNFYGGTDVNTAFQHNGRGINNNSELYIYGAKLDTLSTKGVSGVEDTLNVSPSGTTPTAGTDYSVGARLTENTSHTYAKVRQVLEIKISKQWYADQAGLSDKSEVKNVAWFTSLSHSNIYASGWTHSGHVITDADRTAIKAATGKEYTGVALNDSSNYHGILPNFYILDEPGTDWEQFAGDNNLTVNVKPVTEVPVIDGVIGATEYPSTRTINVADLYNYNADEVQGTEVVEYFGHDAEYIYYAAQFTQTRAGTRAYYLQFKPDNTFDVFNEHYSNRIQYNSRYSEDEDGNNTSYVNNITVNGGTWATPVNDKDIFFYAEKDANSVKTYEFKISKAYIAAVNGIGLDDVKVVPYYVSFHDQCMLGGTFTSDLKVAIATAGGDIPFDDGKTPCYYFMTLEDGELLKVEDRLAINTLETASIRLSPNNPGLRFKSVISTVDLKALMSKYDYIKVGTLIAPEDFDLDLSTVIDDDSLAAGTNYIDVVADVNTPFGSDKSIHVFAGSIVNLHENNIARSFEALGYIAYSADGVNWTYVYAGEASFRSAAEVAHNAIESGDYANDAAALEILEIYAAKFAN